MKQLSRNSFEAAREFLVTKAHPLEFARFQHAFLGCPKEVVLEALDGFQNSDGGFGHGLEADLRAPESSVLCTSVAFQILRSLNVSAEHKLVSSGMDFLMANFDREQCGWRIIPESAEESPRAPWWHQKEREQEFATFSLNPTAEILGYMLEYKELVAEVEIERVTEKVLSELAAVSNVEMHDLLCCLRLFQASSLPQDHRKFLQDKLKTLIVETVSSVPKQWGAYGLRPLQVADTPESPFIEDLEDVVAANLDYEIDSQNEDGSWTPTWSWGAMYPKEWVGAKGEWAGVLTLEKLLLLNKFSRIE